MTFPAANQGILNGGGAPEVTQAVGDIVWLTEAKGGG